MRIVIPPFPPCRLGPQRLTGLLVVTPNGDRPAEGVSSFAAEADAMALALRECARSQERETSGVGTQEPVAEVEANGDTDSKDARGKGKGKGKGKNKNKDSADVEAAHRGAEGGGGDDEGVLLLVDEFGRGTSSRDAAALSAAVLERLARQRGVACLWASHLHDLFAFPQLRGTAWVRMQGFRLTGGQCHDSLGIATARDRGFPPELVERAYFLAKEQQQQLQQQQQQLQQQRQQERARVDPGAVTEGETAAEAGAEARIGSEDLRPDSLSATPPEPCPVRGVFAALAAPGADPPPVLELAFAPPDAASRSPPVPPPPLLAGALVYVLLFAGGGYYVGETEDFERRMRAHRRRSV
jgi:hypothetical protein